MIKTIVSINIIIVLKPDLPDAEADEISAESLDVRV